MNKLDIQVIEDIAVVTVVKNGRNFVIDKNNIPLLSFGACVTKQGYVLVQKHKGSIGSTMLHRIIAKATNNNDVDHINMDKGDNRIENLRLVNMSMNKINAMGHANSSSVYPGVHWSKRRRMWVAQPSINGRRYWCGQHATEEQAWEAVKKFRAEHGIPLPGERSAS